MPVITSRFGSFNLPDADYTIGQMDDYDIALDALTKGAPVKGQRKQLMAIYTAAYGARLLGEWQAKSLADPAPTDSLPAAFVEWVAVAFIAKITAERTVPKGSS